MIAFLSIVERRFCLCSNVFFSHSISIWKYKAMIGCCSNCDIQICYLSMLWILICFYSVVLNSPLNSSFYSFLPYYILGLCTSDPKEVRTMFWICEQKKREGGEVSLHKPKQFWIKQSNAFSKWMFFWFVFFLFFFSLQLNSVVSYIFRSGSPSKSRIRSTLAQGDTLYSPVLSARAGLVISILLEECRLFFFFF